MNNKCPKHGEYQNWMMRCPKCKDEEDKAMIWLSVSAFIIIGLLVVGFNLLRAKLVYHDWRCAWAECRFIK